MTVNGQIPTVGARIVIEGADDAAASFDKASKAQAEFVAGTERLAQAATAEQGSLDSLQQRLHALPEAYQEAALKINASGVKAGTALTAVEEAMKNGVTAAELNAQADEMLTEKMTANAQAAEIQRAALNDDADATKVNADAKKELQDQAIKVGLTFFALSIAARGLRDIGRELGHIYGEDVARSFEKVADTVQTIGSFGSGGALIGSLFGPEGTIIGAGVGASVGVLSSLPALLDKTTVATQGLVDAADSLAHKDDAVTTLARLEDITQKDAQAALDAAKNYQAEADAINNVAKAKQQQENAPTGLAYPGAVPNPDLSQRRSAKDIADDALAASEAEFKLTDALIQQAAAADKLHDVNAKLIDQFDSQADWIEKTTRLTKSDVEEIRAYTDANLGSGEALATSLRALNDLSTAQAKDTEHRNAYAQGIQNETEKVRENSQAILDAAAAQKLYEEQVKAAAAAQKQFEDALQSSNDRLAQLDAKSANDRANAIQSYNDTVDNAVRTENDAIFNAEQSLTDKIADLWQKLGNSIADINSQLADKVNDINTQLGNRLADIETALGNKLADIQQSLANKLEALAHSRDQSIASDNQKIEQAARDLAEKLYEIERTRIEATNALDFNTGEQLRKARTEHDREDILRRHQFDQAQIDQKANDDRHDAEQSFADKIAAANKEKELAKSTYDYQVRLAKELADQQIAQAERDAQQQRIVAQRTAQQQLAVAEREHDQALELAERQYEQEKEAAVKSYNEQVVAAARAEAEKLADARRALDERNKAIAQSYELERAQILQTLALALWAFNKVIDSINLANTHLLGFSQAYQNFLSDPLGLKPDSGLPHGSFPNIGGYGGIDMDVPAGHDRDTFMIGARTGEHVTITPPGVNNSTSNKSMNFYISGVTDPVAVKNIVAGYLSDEAWR